MKRIRAAVVQAAPVAFDRDRTIERVRDLAVEAAGAGAQLIVFPEAFVSGYPRGLDFGVRVGSRTPEGRELFRRYWESAVDVPGPAVEELGAAAREANAHLVIGVIERDGGTLYCTVLFFDPAGALMGKHRKLMPTAAERLIWGQGDGSTMPVFDTPVGRLGAVICWENYMPMLRMHMYARGVQIYCAPTADDRETWLSTMRHIALEGRCFVLGCNQFARRSDYPADYPAHQGEEPSTVMSRGGAASSTRWAGCSPARRSTAPRSSRPSSTSTRSRGASSTSTSPDIMLGPTSSASRSTRRRRRPWYASLDGRAVLVSTGRSRRPRPRRG